MEDELALGFHHSLHVLKGFEAGASGDVAIGGTALPVEPFFPLAD
jgi:hypothetical protein